MRGNTIKYELTDLTKPPKEIFREIIETDASQLLIPPQYSKDEIEISELSIQEKSIGLFSSGTTANPKCIWNTFENLKMNARRSKETFEITGDHRLLIMAKPWHVAGLSWAIMAEELGCEYEFITTIKGEGEEWLNAIQTFQPDYLLTVPPVFRALYEKDWWVKNIITGGIPLKKEDIPCLKSHCSTVYNGYGQTEAGGLIACHKFGLSDQIDENEYRNCGLAIKGVALKSEGHRAQPSPIFIKSKTAYAEGWYNSGDLGYIEGNEVHLTGRSEQEVKEKG